MSFEKITRLQNQVYNLSRTCQDMNNKIKTTNLECNKLKVNNNFLKTEVDYLKSKYECCVCMKEQKKKCYMNHVFISLFVNTV